MLELKPADSAQVPTATFAHARAAEAGGQAERAKRVRWNGGSAGVLKFALGPGFASNQMWVV